MPTAALYTADSFTTTRFAGNPAGVVILDAALPPAEMQAIAGELSLETAFLSPPAAPDADYAVAYYTGAKRIPFCGHDTIAAATVLMHSGRMALGGTVRFATDSGIVPIRVTKEGDVSLALPPPTLGSVLDAAPFVQALGIDAAMLHPAPAQTVTAGTAFVLLGVADEHTLHTLAPHMAQLTALQTVPGAPDGLYVWALADSASSPADIHARCFCPGAGLPEDPVTGSASAAFGAYALRHRLLPGAADGFLDFRTEQGRAMGRTGHVSVAVSESGVTVSGRAVVVSAGTLFL